MQEENPAEIELAIRRILLFHSIILSIGGIPLIYLGDEVGMLNDYSYRHDPAKAKDSRWVHRPFIDWAGPMVRRNQPETVEGRINQGLRRLIDLRKQHVALADGEMEVIPTGNDQSLVTSAATPVSACLFWRISLNSSNPSPLTKSGCMAWATPSPIWSAAKLSFWSKTCGWSRISLCGWWGKDRWPLSSM